MTLPIVEKLRECRAPSLSAIGGRVADPVTNEAADIIEQLYGALLHWQRESRVWADILWFEALGVPGWIELAQGRGDTALAKARGEQ